MKQLRLSLLGFGTVGQWLAEALYLRQAWLQQELDLAITIVSVANAFVIQTDTPAEVTVIGPAAGHFQAGQGMLADLIAISKSR